ncbi:MAG: hypothetical protein ABEJ31_08340 [Haloarculaceae archaeon]
MTRGILVYGSLLHRETLAATLSPETVAEAVPVTVHGYRRAFSMRSQYREGEGGQRGILNAEPAPDARLSAVFVPDVPDDEFEWYRAREARYDLVDVPAADVEPFPQAGDDGRGDARDAIDREDARAAIDRQDARLIATGEPVADTPEPIPYYAAKCVDGARDWGEAFLAEFLLTTHE